MDEVLPGIYRWSSFSEEKGYDFNGHFVIAEKERVLVDPPSIGEADLEWIGRHGPVDSILITNRDHVREAGLFRQRCSARILIHERDAPSVEVPVDGVFRDGDRLPGGFVAVPVPDNKSPGETALYLERDGGILILGDALIGKPPGQFNLMPAEKYADVQKAREGIRVLLSRPVLSVLVGDGVSILHKGRESILEFIQRL